MLRPPPRSPLFPSTPLSRSGDGFPVIPPTAERVQAMLEATPLPPAHVVGVVEPRRGEATVEKIAVNAVLAGCKPEYFPAVLRSEEHTSELQSRLHLVCRLLL